MTDSVERGSVSEPSQVRLLSAPVRQELVDTIAALGGEADIAMLAEQLGRPADGLYYHVRALVAGDLLREVATVAGGERRYRLTSEDGAPLRLTYDLGAGGNTAELRAFVHVMLQVAGRDFEDGLGSENTVVAGTRRELWASRNKGWLSSDDLAEVNVLLSRLSVLTSQPKTDAREHLSSLAFVLAPISALPKRRVPRKGRETNRPGVDRVY